MPRNGSGIQSSPASSFPAVDGTTIEAAKFNAVINDINTEISRSISSDGQTTITADIPMNGYTLTGIPASTASGEPVEHDQLATAIAGVSGDGFEAGTPMLFMKASAPTGWTIDTSFNDRMLYIHGSSGGATGGSHNPILMDVVPSHTHTATTTSTQSTHAHQFTTYGGSSSTTTRTTAALTNGSAFGAVQTDFASAGPITSTTTVNTNASASNWTPKYATAIVATKDA